MSPITADTYRWHDGDLQLLDYCEMSDAGLAVADSWFVSHGSALALNLHKDRFLDAASNAKASNEGAIDAVAFWDAAIAAIPRDGEWFPRVELLGTGRMQFRLRSAPERTRSVVASTFHGDDPRRTPTVKGPDLDAMRRIRTTAQSMGAGETVITTADGYVVEGAYSSIVWWRGSILCYPPDDFDRVNSVTARSLLTLATALGIDTLPEPVTPAELDGCEVWMLNALHGARIVTEWIDGPRMAELPGRLSTWNSRLTALRKPLPDTHQERP
jgi:branched-subunit amino acid aminotransferase/4-amino-4-deoxychorismate lyase